LKKIDALIANVLDGTAEVADRHRAFGEIVARFQDMAWGYAYAILKDHYLAEDVAQEAFIVAWQRLDQLKETKAFPGWFKKILFSECHRLTRGKRLLVTPLESSLTLPSSSPDPQAIAEKIELSEKVFAAIQALPDSERVVTTLFYIDEYSQTDISDFLGLQVTTVAKRLFSARRRLKQGLIGLLKKDLKQHRPSRHEAFASQVQASIRPFTEPDWEMLISMAYGIGDDFCGDKDHRIPKRKQFDESRLIRRQYVGQHAGTGNLLGYGAIEQTIFLPKYRLFFVVASEHLQSGVGDLLLDQLMKDLHEVNAIAVWHRNDARHTDTLNFLKGHGFVETQVVWELTLPVANFDFESFQFKAEQVAARGISIVTYAEARDGDPECLPKLQALLNSVMADEVGGQPFAPVPVETVARWFSRRNLLADACFIARDGEHYIGITSLSLLDEQDGDLTQGFTGILQAYRRQGIATALKLRAIDYARQRGYPLIRAFNHHRNLPMIAFNETLGFRRHSSQTTLEKCLKEVKSIDPSVYDTYVGRYAFDSRTLEKYRLPANLTVTVKTIGAKLISEIRDMQDELFPESESRFFIKMHYGEVKFIRNEQDRVTGLIYRESGKEMTAAKIE
jgi:RNA polymerase sigma factor (sigma-70 family)